MFCNFFLHSTSCPITEAVESMSSPWCDCQEVLQAVAVSETKQVPKSDFIGKCSSHQGRAKRMTFMAFGDLQSTGRCVCSERQYIVHYFLKGPWSWTGRTLKLAHLWEVAMLCEKFHLEFKIRQPVLPSHPWTVWDTFWDLLDWKPCRRRKMCCASFPELDIESQNGLGQKQP